MVREVDPCIGEYMHLRGLSKEGDALTTLRKVASLVNPLMRARGWRVNTLSEFYPDEDNLQGLNVNKTEKILLRLRSARDKSDFIPMESVIDTMLHELSHIVHGPHDSHFMALWDQLREEYQALAAKGYTGEGFLSQGYKLGGQQRLPRHEMKRLARAAAEQRASERSWIGTGPSTSDGKGGIRLGGAPMKPGANPRKVIARTAERRQKILKSCEGTKSRGREQVQEIADKASRNGISTRNTSDEQDEDMAQVWWDLVQEDQMREYGDEYVATTQANPAGQHGRKEKGEKGSSSSARQGYASPGTREAGRFERPLPRHPSRPVSSRQGDGRVTIDTRQPESSHARSSNHGSSSTSGGTSRSQRPSASNRPVSRLVLEDEAKNKRARATPQHHSSPQPKSQNQHYRPSPSYGPIDLTDDNDPPSPTYFTPASSWTCPTCTYHNPPTFLSCDACGMSRSDCRSSTQSSASADYGYDHGYGYAEPPPPRTSRPGGSVASLGVRGAASTRGYWKCRQCRTRMEEQWWTCSTCGKVKESS